MLPRQYPQDAPQMLVEIERGGPAALGALQDLLPTLKGSLTCLFAANGRYGPGICVASLDRPRDKTRSHAKRDLLTKGFRDGKLQPELAIQRFFARGSILRGKIQRADPAWIHGRGRDERSIMLRSSSVVVFGCGSVGSEVAVALLKAGVGTVHLVDHDKLEWANVGRHRLGGAQVGLLKAKELALELGRDFPHAQIVHHVADLEGIVFEEPDWLLSSSLIVGTTGNGHADHALNSWHRSTGRKIPIVYGWTEPRAGAGHAVAIRMQGGCLSSGIDNLGRSVLEMTRWEDSAVKMEEPACGVHFAPYGAIELSYINTMIADLALDCLLGDDLASSHRAWLARKSLLHSNGGSWTPEAIQAMATHDRGGIMVDLEWAACGCCKHEQQGVNAAAA
jgi:molybdopterin/thiamine biosynthesis adenylyltransferase